MKHKLVGGQDDTDFGFLKWVCLMGNHLELRGHKPFLSLASLSFSHLLHPGHIDRQRVAVGISQPLFCAMLHVLVNTVAIREAM